MGSGFADRLEKSMNDPAQVTISDYVEAALEASCDMLITLEVVRRLSGEHEAGRRTLRALSLTRRVIDELRLIRDQEATNALSSGFVLAAKDSSAAAAADGGFVFS
jgi:hypothetical protein